MVGVWVSKDFCKIPSSTSVGFCTHACQAEPEKGLLKELATRKSFSKLYVLHLCSPLSWSLLSLSCVVPFSRRKKLGIREINLLLSLYT